MILCFLDLKSDSSENIHHSGTASQIETSNLKISLLELYLMQKHPSGFPIIQSPLDKCDQDIDL